MGGIIDFEYKAKFERLTFRLSRGTLVIGFKDIEYEKIEENYIMAI